MLALPDRQTVQPVRTDALLTCLVHAFPPAELYWLRGARGEARLPTIGGEKYRVQNWTVDEYSVLFGLHIYSIASSDYGAYRCRARNDLGEDEASVVIYGNIYISVKKLNSLKHPVRTTVAGSHN